MKAQCSIPVLMMPNSKQLSILFIIFFQTFALNGANENQGSVKPLTKEIAAIQTVKNDSIRRKHILADDYNALVNENNDKMATRFSEIPPLPRHSTDILKQPILKYSHQSEKGRQNSIGEWQSRNKLNNIDSDDRIIRARVVRAVPPQRIPANAIATSIVGTSNNIGIPNICINPPFMQPEPPVCKVWRKCNLDHEAFETKNWDFNVKVLPYKQPGYTWLHVDVIPRFKDKKPVIRFKYIALQAQNIYGYVIGQWQYVVPCKVIKHYDVDGDGTPDHTHHLNELLDTNSVTAYQCPPHNKGYQQLSNVLVINFKDDRGSMYANIKLSTEEMDMVKTTNKTDQGIIFVISYQDFASRDCFRNCRSTIFTIDEYEPRTCPNGADLIPLDCHREDCGKVTRQPKNSIPLGSLAQVNQFYRNKSEEFKKIDPQDLTILESADFPEPWSTLADDYNLNVHNLSRSTTTSTTLKTTPVYTTTTTRKTTPASTTTTTTKTTSVSSTTIITKTTPVSATTTTAETTPAPTTTTTTKTTQAATVTTTIPVPTIITTLKTTPVPTIITSTLKTTPVPTIIISTLKTTPVSTIMTTISIEKEIENFENGTNPNPEPSRQPSVHNTIPKPPLIVNIIHYTKPTTVATIDPLDPPSDPIRTVAKIVDVVPKDEIYDNCGRTRGCFGFPNECIFTRSCQNMVSYGLENNKVVFEILGTARKYVAVGLSADKYMGTDSVVECVREGPNGIRTYMSWNLEKGSMKKNQRMKNNSPVSQITAQYNHVDGTLYCKFLRDVVSQLHNHTFDLEKDRFYLIFAAGNNARDGIHGNIGYHETALVSHEKIGFLKDAENFVFQKAMHMIHGILMIITWIILYPIGTFLSRYFKETFVTVYIGSLALWFGVHVLLLTASTIFTVLTVILVAIGEGGIPPVGLGWDFHSSSGILITFLMILSIILGCTIAKFNTLYPFRFYALNFLHGFIGHIVLLLAYANILDARDIDFGMPCDSFTPIVVWIVIYITVHLLMMYQVCYTDFILGKSVSRAYTSFGTLDIVDMDSESEAPGAFFRKCLLYAFIFFSVLFGLILIFSYWQDPDNVSCQMYDQYAAID